MKYFNRMIGCNKKSFSTMCAVYTMKVNDDYWLTVYNLHPLKRFIMSSPTDAVKK